MWDQIIRMNAYVSFIRDDKRIRPGAHGAHYILCKGIRKTKAALGLSFLACNLKRQSIEKVFREYWRESSLKMNV